MDKNIVPSKLLEYKISKIKNQIDILEEIQQKSPANTKIECSIQIRELLKEL